MNVSATGQELLAAADQQLVEGVLARRPRALAKAITLVESTRRDHRARAEQVLAALLPHTGNAIRVGISGAPGAGKSTFVRMLAAWQAAGQTGEAKQSPPAISPDLLPVFVVLRQLSPRLAALELDGLPNEQQKGMLVTAVEKHLCDDLATLDAGTFAHTLRHTLHSGRCLLIFDGLDEVPHDSRMRMRQAVGALLQRWRPARVLVTCRIRSYVGEAELPDFQVHTLAPLDRPRIQKFAAAWYDAQVTLRRLEAAQARRKADDLAAAAVSAELIELAENPMMLTAMAIIHQKEIGLPRQGVCLYKEVVEVLLRRWQKEKVGEKELTPSPALRSGVRNRQRIAPLTWSDLTPWRMSSRPWRIRCRTILGVPISQRPHG